MQLEMRDAFRIAQGDWDLGQRGQCDLSLGVKPKKTTLLAGHSYPQLFTVIVDT